MLHWWTWGWNEVNYSCFSYTHCDSCNRCPLTCTFRHHNYNRKRKTKSQQVIWTMSLNMTSFQTLDRTFTKWSYQYLIKLTTFFFFYKCFCPILELCSHYPAGNLFSPKPEDLDSHCSSLSSALSGLQLPWLVNWVMLPDCSVLV